MLFLTLCHPTLPRVLVQEKLGLTHLVGTPLLRAYMHGFFIDNRLYGKAKAIAGGFLDCAARGMGPFFVLT